MEDDRVWSFERSLWDADPQHYAEAIDNEQILMVLPQPPYIYEGEAAVKAVQQTPRWSEVELDQQHVTRPQEGLIVVAYRVHASKGDETYEAHCTSTYRRLGHDDWKVIQHQQTPPLAASAES
jgi:hypothetical protein